MVRNECNEGLLRRITLSRYPNSLRQYKYVRNIGIQNKPILIKNPKHRAYHHQNDISFYERALKVRTKNSIRSIWKSHLKENFEIFLRYFYHRVIKKWSMHGILPWTMVKHVLSTWRYASIVNRILGCCSFSTS